MIFFEKEITPFNSENGMKISPIPCTLKNNSIGFYLGAEWTEEVIERGAVVKTIAVSDLKILDDE